MQNLRCLVLVVGLTVAGCALVERHPVDLTTEEVAALEAEAGPLSSATEGAWESALERLWKVDVVSVTAGRDGAGAVAVLASPLADGARRGAQGAVGGVGGGWQGAAYGALTGIVAALVAHFGMRGRWKAAGARVASLFRKAKEGE